jgi:hypothetical protein
MTSSLNQSESWKMHIIQSHCMNTTKHGFSLTKKSTPLQIIYLMLADWFRGLGNKVSNSDLMSLTKPGPIRNDMATPSDPHRAATAVAVVL